MGGRLDAVNAVEPDACLITNIALDHMAWLGSDIESIAREKAGIMRSRKPAVFGGSSVPNAITEYADSVGADLRLAGQDFGYQKNEAAGSWSWHGRNGKLSELCPPALAGDVQYQNAAAVLATIEAMGLEDLLTTAHVNDALGKLALPGRFQVIQSRRTWVLDVAHNPAAAAVLAESLASLSHDGKVTAIVGMLADKDVAASVELLSALVGTWIAVPVDGPRAESAPVLAQKIANCTGKPCRIENAIPGALKSADQRSPVDELILVTGSFYVVGPALEWLHNN
jgi:dihydrofolate synthase/folylpolyglutamate synthase